VETKIIENKSEYDLAMGEIDQLMEKDPDVDSKEADRLGLLALLVSDYESRNFNFGIPDPIEAIQFRMDQRELTQRDIVPFIGSRSKVSEVLSRKRPLTLTMIRALHKGLDIPAEVLLEEPGAILEDDDPIEWDRYPIKEMAKRGWVNLEPGFSKARVAKILDEFFAPLRYQEGTAAFYRRTRQIRSARKVDEYALDAWLARVCRVAFPRELKAYVPRTVDIKFMTELSRLSLSETGPQIAREFLNKCGIGFVVEPHLSRTRLDGAALLLPTGNPVIGLTLRYDRIDYFWFCLMHELAHVSLHLSQKDLVFFDDLEAGSETNVFEKEADDIASEAVIPRDVWLKSPASKLRSPGAAMHLANKLGIHPAIVAGRMRHEARNYKILNQLVGHGEVRKLFPEIDWSNS